MMKLLRQRVGVASQGTLSPMLGADGGGYPHRLTFRHAPGM